MTCILRYVDGKYLLPKRQAFAAQIESGEVEVAGHTIDDVVGKDGRVEIEGQEVENESLKKDAEVSVKPAGATKSGGALGWDS